MLVSVRFSNFFSFAEETFISFEMGKKPSRSAFDVAVTTDRRLNKVIAIVGSNGSGKTQLIKPIAFLSLFTSMSFLGAEPDSKLPFKPHALL